MRKYMRLLLLTGVFMALLCGSAMAATVTEATPRSAEGIQKGNMKANYTIVPAAGENAVRAGVIGENRKTTAFYEGAVRVDLDYTRAQSGEEYLVFLLKGETTVPQEENIVYINQATAENGKFSFNVYPSELTPGVYTICISSSVEGEELTSVGTFTYRQVQDYREYLLGDPNADGKVNISDAMYIVRAALHTGFLTDPRDITAANVNGDKTNNGTARINVSDAMLIVRYIKNKTLEFETIEKG